MKEEGWKLQISASKTTFRRIKSISICTFTINFLFHLEKEAEFNRRMKLARERLQKMYDESKHKQ